MLPCFFGILWPPWLKKKKKIEKMNRPLPDLLSTPQVKRFCPLTARLNMAAACELTDPDRSAAKQSEVETSA